MSFPSIYDPIADQLKPLIEEGKKLAYVGRFCPMHLGHQMMIGGMVTAAKADHILFIGSCNRPLSIRYMFSYVERESFIRAVFPQIRIAPLPDYKDDNSSWFHSLDALIRLTDTDPDDIVFIGGSTEDVQWFIDNGRAVKIVNRYSGITLDVSGAKIRDNLITGNREKLHDLLDHRIVDSVCDSFTHQWAKLRNQ